MQERKNDVYKFVDHIVSILDSYGHTYVWAGVGLIAQVFTRYRFTSSRVTVCSIVVRWCGVCGLVCVCSRQLPWQRLTDYLLRSDSPSTQTEVIKERVMTGDKPEVRLCARDLCATT